MKKILKISLLCISLMFLTSGCMKINYDMTINRNKSIDFSALSAYLEDLGENESIFSKEEMEELSKKGVTVSDYKEDGYVGYRLFKHFDNIDDVSDKENVTNNIEDFFDEKPQKTYFFKIEKGFLKNKYKAYFDVSNMNMSLDNLEESINDVDSENVDTTDTMDTVESAENENIDVLNNMDFSNMMTGMEAKFVVRLPYKNISNNATNVSSDGKTLTWDFITNQNLKTIEFEFEIWDQTIMYIGILLVVLIVIAIIASIVNRPKKVVTSEEEFQKQLNISTMGDPEEIDDVLGTNMVNK